MAFAALDSLHPISHAVANTIKRVVIIVVSVLVFRNPVRATWVGCGLVCDSIELINSFDKYKQISSPAPGDVNAFTDEHAVDRRQRLGHSRGIRLLARAGEDQEEVKGCPSSRVKERMMCVCVCVCESTCVCPSFL